MAFSDQAFSLLRGLHEDRTYEFYKSHQADLKKYVEKPFRDRFSAIATSLESLEPLATQLQLKRDNFGRIWMGGSAAEVYWGAFYPKRTKNKQQDVQLLVSINYQALEFGLVFAHQCPQKHKQQFLANCERLSSDRATYELLLTHLEKNVPESQLVYRDREYEFRDDGDVVSQNYDYFFWDDFLQYPQQEAENPNDLEIFSPMMIWPQQQVLGMSDSELSARIAETFKQLFLLVLLAISPQPVPAIQEYLASIAVFNNLDNH